MIAIIDYGMGNLQSVSGGLRRVGADVAITSNREDLQRADGIILPGVGAFEMGMNNLRERDLLDVIADRAGQGTTFLGICLGMQLVLGEGEEHGTQQGLDLIPGRVIRFTGDVKIPHMGWNDVAFAQDVPLFAGLEKGRFFYFVPSYFCVPENDSDIIGTTTYDVPFASAVGRGNVFGTQFHPEKSQIDGLAVLRNFVEDFVCHGIVNLSFTPKSSGRRGKRDDQCKWI